jgi:serine/threonine-protein kinase RsbW
VSGAAAQAVTCYQGTYHGRADQVRRVRAAVAAHLGDCPVTDDAILIVSELVTNSILHSESKGEFFTVRAELFPSYVWLEVEDLGGAWQCRQPDERPHGLEIVGTLAGADNWGVEMTGDGDRIVWARLELAARA